MLLTEFYFSSNTEQIVNKYVFKACQIMSLPRMPIDLDLALSLPLFSNKDEDSPESLFLFKSGFMYK